MKKLFKFILFVILLCFSTSVVFASDPDKLLKFADELKASGEYYRAITEYNRFNVYGYGAPKIRLQNMFKMADCFEMGGQYNDAHRIYSDIADKYPDYRMIADMHRVTLLSKEGKYGESNSLIHNLIDQKPNNNDGGLLRLAEAKNDVHLGKYENAKKLFLDVATSGLALSGEAQNYADTLEHELPLKKKSKLAGVMLGIPIPGAGYFYINKPGTAIAALIVIGLFGYSTYELFDREIYGLGSVMGLATTGFYFGSLYGTAQGVNKFNNDKMARLAAKFSF